MDEVKLPYDSLRFDYKERMKDRFLATHLHRFEMFRTPVAIAVVIEIINPWHPTSEYGQKIINNIVREFLHSDGQSFLVRFEMSLKQINRTIEEATAKLGVEIACVALLLEENQVHCAGIGQASIGLYRSGHLSTIISGRAASQPTFSSVTSGDLRQDDWLILANADFYSEIETFKAETWNYQPSLVVDQLVSQKLANPRNYWAGLLFRYNQSSPTDNQTTFWEEARPTPTGRLPKFNLPTNLDWLPKLPARESATAFLSQAAARTTKIFGQLLAIIKLPGQVKFPDLQARRLLIPIVIVILILAVAGITIGYRRAHRPVTKITSHTTLTTEINALSPDDQLKGLLEKFTSNSYQSLSNDDQQSLISTLANQKIILTDLPVASTTAPNEIVALDIIDGQPILIDNQGQVWIYKNSTLNKLEQKQLVANPVSLTALATNNIVVSDATGNIWRLDGTANSPVALVQPKTLPLAVKIVSNYKGNLYISVTDLKITFRVTGFTTDLASAAIYNKGDALALAAINDLAINGEVVAADNAGKVVSYSKGKLGAVTATLPAVDGVFHLNTNDKSPVIAVSSGRLIYLLNSTGAIQKTIFLATDDKITDLALDPIVPNTVWVTIGNQLHHLTLP